PSLPYEWTQFPRSAVPWYLARSTGERREPQGNTAILFGGRVPTQRPLVGRPVGIAVHTLDRLALEQRVSAARLEQSVHRLDAQPASIRLVSPVAGSLQLRKPLVSRRLVQDLSDRVAVQQARRVDLSCRLRQAELDRDGVGGPSGARRALESGGELVHGPLRDADQRGHQVPAEQDAERRAVAQVTVQLP